MAPVTLARSSAFLIVEEAMSGIHRRVHGLLSLRNLYILFVDSEPIGRERMQQALGNGFVIQCASSLPDAWRCLEVQLPDVLICEVLLGEESGLELCRAVRRTESFSHLPVMLLTTLTTFQDKVAGFDAGADDYVVKPFDPRHLMARIRLLSRIKRMEVRGNR